MDNWEPRFGDIVRVKGCEDSKKFGLRLKGKEGQIIPSWLRPDQVHNGHLVAVALFYMPSKLRGQHGQYVWHFRLEELELVKPYPHSNRQAEEPADGPS